MTDFTQTIMPPGGRGCGKRKKGGTYGCMGTGADGTPIWEFLLDPALPWHGDKFQGVQVAPPELTEGQPDDMLVILDMVGMEAYPTVPSFVEETGRFGLSRRIPSTFDWTQTTGKRVFLGCIHWRAQHRFTLDNPLSLHELPVNGIRFKHCKTKFERSIIAWEQHFLECLYWLWPLTWEWHDHDKTGCVVMPWGKFSPLHVIKLMPTYDPAWTSETLVTQFLPQADYGPGVFALFPMTHVECVGYVPDESNVGDSGLPVIVTEE
jgi:hypothetical protein